MEPTTVSLSWQAILGLALTSGAVSTGITLFVDWLRSSRAEKRLLERDARYLAVRLATSLETFALDCADVVGRNDMQDDEAAAVEGTTLLPAFPAFPLDADWKALDSVLAAGVLSIPNELKIGQLTVTELVEITGDIQEGYGVVSDHAGKCGYRALTLASRLRERYELPRPDFGPRLWDFESELKRHHDALAERVAGTKAKAA